MATKKRGKKLVSVDFTGVTAGGGRLLPEGRYTFEVDDVQEKEGEDSGEPYFELTVKVAEGEYEGTKAWDNLSLQSQALWKLRSFMEAAGFETEDGPMDIDPDEFIGAVFDADVIHEDYKNRTKHRIAGYIIPDDAKAQKTDKAATRGGNGAGVRRKAAARDEDEAVWKVKQRVSFKEGKKTIEGIISQIDGDNVTVRVGRDEYEMGPDDLQAA